MECGIDDVVTTYSISNAFVAYSLDFPIMRSIACEIWRVLYHLCPLQAMRKSPVCPGMR